MLERVTASNVLFLSLGEMVHHNLLAFFSTMLHLPFLLLLLNRKTLIT